MLVDVSIYVNGNQIFKMLYLRCGIIIMLSFSCWEEKCADNYMSRLVFSREDKKVEMLLCILLIC